MGLLSTTESSLGGSYKQVPVDGDQPLVLRDVLIVLYSSVQSSLSHQGQLAVLGLALLAMRRVVLQPCSSQSFADKAVCLQPAYATHV